MQIISKTRAKREENRHLPELKDYELAFFTAIDKDSVKQGDFENRFTWFKFEMLYDRGPTGWKLWNDYSQIFLDEFIKNNPCRRPYCFWLYGTPDADTADWADLRDRAEWSPKRQMKYLVDNDLLTPAERRLINEDTGRKTESLRKGS